MTLEKAETGEDRIEAIIELCMKLAAGDFRARGTVSERCDHLDAVVTAMNMLGEELELSANGLKEAQTASLNIMEDLDMERKSLSAVLKERNELLEKVERANKELHDFAYIISHDLKAPLRAIGTITSWLVQDYKDKLDDAGKEQLSILSQRTQRMHEMIEGILHYSRAGRAMGEPVLVDTGKVVRQVIESLIPPENMRITICDPLPSVFIDPMKISQVFQNLISNAIKHMNKAEGLIEVGSRDAGELYEFFVKDNGPGIEERHFERIFQIFQTLKPRDEFESTGIGLTIVKKIIEQSGGRIWVESKVGKGSSFRFTLPKS